jgi:hypothetical protein
MAHALKGMNNRLANVIGVFNDKNSQFCLPDRLMTASSI